MNNKSMLLNVVKGALTALIVSVILVVGLTIFMLFKEPSSTAQNIIMVVFMGISIAIGAILATKKNGKKGWLIGSLVAILYFLSMYIISGALNGLEFKQFDLFRFIMAIVVGFVSGILGINL